MYNLSTDYEKLYEFICAGVEVPCFVDNEIRNVGILRDIARVKRCSYFDITIGARGISYYTIHPWHSDKGMTEKQLFIEVCSSLQLEYIEPHASNDDVIIRLTQCNIALQYAAFNFDRKVLSDLPEGIIESTCPSTTCLIEVRNNLMLIDRLKQQKKYGKQISSPDKA